jgi:hypothetical protein
VKCFFLEALSFCETGVTRLSVGEMYVGLLSDPDQYGVIAQEKTHYWFFAIFFANKAFAPIPGRPFAALWGRETMAAWEGLCRGWI